MNDTSAYVSLTFLLMPSLTLWSPLFSGGEEAGGVGAEPPHESGGTYAIILSMDELVREYLRANPFTFKRWAVQYAKAIVADNVESCDACIDFPELPDIRFDADWETMIVIRLQRTLLTALQQIQEGHQSVDNCLEELRNELAKRKHEHRLLNRDLTELLEATSEAE